MMTMMITMISITTKEETQKEMLALTEAKEANKVLTETTLMSGKTGTRVKLIQSRK